MNKLPLKFSLVLCTINRDKDVEKFLDSVLVQDYDNFEIIIVDQNSDDRVVDIVKKFSKISEKIKLIKSEKGLSRARNIGLSYVSGDIIAFPDDDCIYAPNVLSRVEMFFSNKEDKQIVYSTNTRDFDTGFSLIQTPKDPTDFDSNLLIGCSFTLFFDSSVAKFKFDERLGVGSGFVWGAAEEHDYLYRILNDSYTGYFEPDVLVFHPAKENDSVDINRAYYYGAGLGAFRLKHFTKFRCAKSFVGLVKDTLALLFSFKFNKAAFKFIFLIGYVMGLISWGISIR